MMTVLFGAAEAIGLITAIYFICRRKPHAFLVLSYSKVGVPPKNSHLKHEWISAKKLAKTLSYLQKNNFTTIPLQALHQPQNLPQKPVLLAFMGGYQSFFTEVFPLLQKFKMHASVFLAHDCVGTYNAWQDPHQEPWQNMLTKDQLKTLAKSGWVSFGAIGLNGQDLTLLPAAEQTYLTQENCFRLKHQLHLTPKAFAFYPAQKWDEKKGENLTLKNLPILLPIHGINSIKMPRFLKTLSPAAHPWRTCYTLWKHR